MAPTATTTMTATAATRDGMFILENRGGSPNMDLNIDGVLHGPGRAR
jgi:hypothetical protein